MSEQNEVRGQIAKIIEDYEGDMPLDNKKFKLVKTKRTNKAVTDILSIPEIQEALGRKMMGEGLRIFCHSCGKGITTPGACVSSIYHKPIFSQSFAF